MTISYPLCVFLESRDQGKLPPGHPFCHLVRETIHSIMIYLPILHHMARNTLENPDEVAVKQRAQEIIQYLQNTCPTFSGSDSPVMHSTFVDVRAYSGCHGGKGPKDTRKHIYVQKRLVDNWMKGSAGTRPFYILTIFIRLCLIRGLITVVKLAFNPEKINVKPEPRGSPCSLENFFSQWNGWLVFNSLGTTCVHRKALPYHELWNIVFSDRVTTFSYSDLGRIQNLERLAAGDWTAWNEYPYPSGLFNVFGPHSLRMWDSEIDPKPRKMIETDIR